MRDDGLVDIIKLHAVNKSRGVNNIEADLQEIVNFITPFDPDIICADMGDSANYIDKLAYYFGKERVYGVTVNPTPKSSGRVNPAWNEQDGTVRIDKLTMNKRHIADIKMGRVGFYSERDRMLDMYLLHWGNVVIRDEEDDDKNVYQVIGKKGEDHLAQSSVYGMVGMQKLIEMYRTNTENAFNYTSIEEPAPTPTDIFRKHM
jgi:hypothetical protein